jgi:hypothetical protein
VPQPERASPQETRESDGGDAHAAVTGSGDAALVAAGKAESGSSGRDGDGQPAPEEPGTGTDLHRPESEEDQKVYVDGHEIEVTGDPADGIWVPGLPGEVPDKTGDVLAGPEKEKPRGDRFFHAMVDGADNMFDAVEKRIHHLRIPRSQSRRTAIRRKHTITHPKQAASRPGFSPWE